MVLTTVYLVLNVQIEDVEDERRNAEQVTLAMMENLVRPGCSSQSSSFQTEATGFTSTSLPFASSSVSHFIRGSFEFVYKLLSCEMRVYCALFAINIALCVWFWFSIHLLSVALFFLTNAFRQNWSDVCKKGTKLRYTDHILVIVLSLFKFSLLICIIIMSFMLSLFFAGDVGELNAISCFQSLSVIQGVALTGRNTTSPPHAALW